MHYPFEEEGAGELRDSHRTSDASEYLMASPEVISLAQAVLTPDKLEEAEQLARDLTGNKRQKDAARARLVRLAAPPPKRPMYYAQHEMQFLPRWTRDALRDLGDFIDMLVKSAVYEKTQRPAVFHSSLGPAIEAFRGNWPAQSELATLLKQYNRMLYRDAKHDFKLPPGRKDHRFTSREVVLTVFITLVLAERLSAISPSARAARNDDPIPGL